MCALIRDYYGEQWAAAGGAKGTCHQLGLLTAGAKASCASVNVAACRWHSCGGRFPQAVGLAHLAFAVNKRILLSDCLHIPPPPEYPPSDEDEPNMRHYEQPINSSTSVATPLIRHGMPTAALHKLQSIAGAYLRDNRRHPTERRVLTQSGMYYHLRSDKTLGGSALIVRQALMH